MGKGWEREYKNQLQRTSIASTKVTINKNQSQTTLRKTILNKYPGQKSNQVVSPLSRNLKNSASQGIISIKTKNSTVSPNEMVQRTQEYQKFFQNNQDKVFEIASCVITGNKIQSKAREKFLMQVSQGTDAYIQTQEEQDILNKSELDFQQEIEQEMGKTDPNLIYQGAFVKVFKAQKEQKPKSMRPMSAAPMQIRSKTLQHLQAANQAKEDASVKIQDLGPFKKVNYRKLIQQSESKCQAQSIFKDNKQKTLELTDYLNMILAEYQKQEFDRNQQQIDQTLTSHFNQSKSGPDQLSHSDLNYKQRESASQYVLHEYELKRSEQESQVNSTGLRLRMLTAKFGPKVDLISHGFQNFKVQDIEQFFDPMRLKLMTATLSDIPNQQTKQGSDFHFIKGCKYQLQKDFQQALNSYEQGIKEYPNSSFNCKLNKAVILFKLGLFKEALKIFKDLYTEDQLDKRVNFNKAICELQNGKYSQCIQTIDKYFEDFAERKRKLDQQEVQLEGSPQKALSYQEKIRINKPQYNPDEAFMSEFYQIRGVSCLRSNKVIEAAQSFVKAQEYKQKINKKHIEQQKKVDNYIEVAIEKESPQRKNVIKGQNDNTAGILFEDQDAMIQQPIIRIRPTTAKLLKSQSQQMLGRQLDTLAEEVPYEDTNENVISQQDDLLSSQDNMFSIDPESVMKELDQYEQEHKQIKSQVLRIQKQGSFLNIYKNIETVLQGHKRPATASTKKNNFHFNQNLMMNIEKPKGTILNFISSQEEGRKLAEENKKFKEKIKNYELSVIQQKKPSKMLTAFHSKKSSIQQQQLKQQQQQTQHRHQTSSDLDWKFLDVQALNSTPLSEEELYRNEPEVEENIFMRPQDLYIDYERRIRLDKVLLGFEIDDTMTPEEHQVRQRRAEIEKELTEGKDSFFDQFVTKEDEQKRDYLLQFLKIEEKDAQGQVFSTMTKDSINELNQLQNNVDKLRSQIDKIFNDPQKTDLHIDQSRTHAKDLNNALSSQNNLKNVNKTMDSTQSLPNATKFETQKKQKPKVLRRIDLQVLEKTLDELQKPQIQRDYDFLNQVLCRLKFFIKFPNEIRLELLRYARLRKFKENDVIFNQGDPSNQFFVIVRGTIGISVSNQELGYLTVNSKVCYDGDYFGELVHFEESPTLSAQLIKDLNRQRTTAKAMEECYILEIDKHKSNVIINSGLQGKFEQRITFLKQIDIFKDIDMYILLPLASNIQIKTFKMGQYIVRAGEIPEGLFILNQGHCIVCAEKLAMRSNQPSDYARLKEKQPNIKTNPTGSSQIVYDKNQMKLKNMKQSQIKGLDQHGLKLYSDSLQQVNAKNRSYQNELLLVDDNGTRMRDFIVSKDLMIFFDLLPKSYFGGRILLPPQAQKRTADENPMRPLSGNASGNISHANTHRRAWFAGGKTPLPGRAGASDDFEHLFIKRRYSNTTQNIMKNDRSSMLSVIAHSSEVEVYIIDQQLMEFFPENTQKQVWAKLLNAFESDRPYTMKNVQKIKDKFREWDVYKIKTIQDKLKQNFNLRQENKQKQVVTLDR